MTRGPNFTLTSAGPLCSFPASVAQCCTQSGFGRVGTLVPEARPDTCKARAQPVTAARKRVRLGTAVAQFQRVT